ncbi:MAG: 23S rRNA (adenine(2030)-N(6))-methyltransferase RlmJ [Opitutaceae bacterium]|nr:23S rRNA (adenine(2030)-N(6))-methyltransferase RlmJ [Opitutaceae bacterium]
MNYRHHFHAGNFADVLKHAVLLQLVAAMQRKPKGFLYLDTHAGRGGYDLNVAVRGDTLARIPEWPEGIGRLLAQADLPEMLREYVVAVRAHDRRQGNTAAELRFYPGSPALVGAKMREQDRMALCEQQPDECAALQAAMARTPRCAVRAMDGYEAVGAMLPPPERRALLLIDPPFESEREFADIIRAVGEGLRRLPDAVMAIWYPLTLRARVDAFFDGLTHQALPPTMVAELEVASEASALKMRGCGLVIINPPWQLLAVVQPGVTALSRCLSQGAGARAACTWLVPER